MFRRKAWFDRPPSVHFNFPARQSENYTSFPGCGKNLSAAMRTIEGALQRHQSVLVHTGLFPMRRSIHHLTQESLFTFSADL